ncbi:hypothetical protein [Nocardia jiangxiensis]|uniref:hypothetical protein n=1 Tax=Nocardia jiangxiensis TaxID=282685 RepID=UPI0002E09504|nr:hypothetical protein [Nocardia jiangxiensis]
MRSLMIAAVGAVIAVGPVVGAGVALAGHPLPSCADVNTSNVPCQSQDDPMHFHGTDHNASHQPHEDSLSAPSTP